MVVCALWSCGVKKAFESLCMRFLFKLFSFACLLNFLALPLGGVSLVIAAEDDTALLEIVESSCKKSCVENKGGEAFCSSYCKCVNGRLTQLAKKTDLAKILQDEKQQETFVHQCSGETAVKFFAHSCREKCAGASKCNSYCSCLENQITNKRKFSEIGAFFIQLGKNETGATDRLKRYEKACSR